MGTPLTKPTARAVGWLAVCANWGDPWSWRWRGGGRGRGVDGFGVYGGGGGGNERDAGREDCQHSLPSPPHTHTPSLFLNPKKRKEKKWNRGCTARGSQEVEHGAEVRWVVACQVDMDEDRWNKTGRLGEGRGGKRGGGGGE
eukprot:Sspe_Gene.23695::Locus_9251_Transcript_1_1_Confidence_1.000_Length_467::g.23695::m.23695